jgi:hypothetical protein
MTARSFEMRLRRLEERHHTNRPKAHRTLPGWLKPDTSSSVTSGSPAAWKYEALPAQCDFHGDLTTRFKGYSGPIGSGKSYALAYEALFLSMLNPGLLGLIGAPTYKMLEDSTRRSFFEVLDTEGIGFTFNKQENCVRLAASGSEIIFRSMENPDRLRGQNLAWFGLDELTYTREEAWTRILGRLRHPDAARLCGFAVWTPKGYDWVYRRFVEENNPDYRLVKATPRENTHLPTDFYDQLRHSYAERFYRQEVMGEYLDIYGGNVYEAFSNENIKPVSYDPGLPLCWALDFNVDFLCSVICQIHERTLTHPLMTGYPNRAVVHVLDEIVLPDSRTVAAMRDFIRRALLLPNIPDRLMVEVYGDKSGNSRQTSAERTDYELVREVFQQHSDFQITMFQNKKNPEVRDRVNQ